MVPGPVLPHRPVTAEVIAAVRTGGGHRRVVRVEIRPRTAVVRAGRDMVLHQPPPGPLVRPASAGGAQRGATAQQPGLPDAVGVRGRLCRGFRSGCACAPAAHRNSLNRTFITPGTKIGGISPESALPRVFRDRVQRRGRAIRRKFWVIKNCRGLRHRQQFRLFLGCGGLSSRTGTDDDHVIISHGCHLVF